MATGINYDDPEVRRGMELFGALFPPREPTPPRETGPSAEDIRKGAELFEALFYLSSLPSEISEETPPAAEPTPSPPRPPPVVLEPSPPKPTTPPRRIAVNTPPDWLVRSMDRDQFELPTHPDWYKRFKDPEYRTPPSPRQHVLFTSPPYFPDISSDDSALDEAFLPPSPPPPPEVYSPEPEPLPITEAANYIEGVPFTSFDERFTRCATNSLNTSVIKNIASVFKSAKADKPSETFDFGDDIEKPNEEDFDLATAKQYLIMLYYSMERERLDRENEIRIAFGEPPIPRSKYAI
ncbi:hypothetical protein HNY73_017919 [Argiope bruennichi]|uniref:Uncharacterized protein n=1 Tax=Argiope bruennichi TaxID=94029 RepID=A0A8T0ECC3_ARGBR|nr:hypothetical protein HNY73_017919 [Argiope bruennichi]